MEATVTFLGVATDDEKKKKGHCIMNCIHGRFFVWLNDLGNEEQNVDARVSLRS
jgi:hypothetical protein